MTREIAKEKIGATFEVTSKGSRDFDPAIGITIWYAADARAKTIQ